MWSPSVFDRGMGGRDEPWLGWYRVTMSFVVKGDRQTWTWPEEKAELIVSVKPWREKPVAITTEV
jgi:hypothetical protein